ASASRASRVRSGPCATRSTGPSPTRPRAAMRASAQAQRSTTMEFFMYTGDVKEVREAHAMGLVDGITTNPSLIAKSGRKYKEVVVEMCEIVNGPISAEVLSTQYDEMMAEARE